MENVRLLEKIIGRGQTIVVDNALQFQASVPWKRAVTMVMADEAYTLIPNLDGKLVRSPSTTVQLPLVVCLHRFVTPRPTSPSVSRRAIYIRDGNTCQYCLKRGNTIDHILPKSRGGGNTWENLCVACFDCNTKKSDRTPQEAGMRVPVIPNRIDVELQHVIQENMEGIMEIMSGIQPQRNLVTAS